MAFSKLLGTDCKICFDLAVLLHCFQRSGYVNLIKGFVVHLNGLGLATSFRTPCKRFRQTFIIVIFVPPLGILRLLCGTIGRRRLLVRVSQCVSPYGFTTKGSLGTILSQVHSRGGLRESDPFHVPSEEQLVHFASKFHLTLACSIIGFLPLTHHLFNISIV